MRPSLLALCAAAAITTLFAACSTAPPAGTGGMAAMPCAPGAKVECTCNGSDRGTQTCAVDGSGYGLCDCSSAPDAGSGGGGAAPDGGGDGGDGGDAGPLPGAPVVLLQGLSGVQDLIAYTNNLFWTSADGSGAVAQCSTSGCDAPLILASGQVFPRGVVVTNGVVLWSVYQTNEDGGVGLGLLGRATAGAANTGKTYLAGELHPDAVAADPNNVYWSSEGAVKQCELFGCQSPILLAADTARAIAVDASYVYWVNTLGRVYRGVIGGATGPLPISTTDEPTARGLVLAGGNVFWAGAGAVLTCPITGCSGAPTSLATGQNIVALRHPLAGDGAHLYWSSDKAVVRCPLKGCPAAGPEVVAGGLFEPTSVAVDATWVYWVDGDSIKKIQKPQ